MAKYRCQLCGHIYDEEKEGIKFEELPDDWKCPMCFAPKSMFKLVEEDNNKQETAEQEETKQEGSKSIELKYVRYSYDCNRRKKYYICYGN